MRSPSIVHRTTPFALAFAVSFVACVGSDPTPEDQTPGAQARQPTDPAPAAPIATGAPSPTAARTCYPDMDGDGYPGTGSAQETTGPCPARTTERAAPLDCNDALANAHPDQTTFFPASTSGYDFDCNGADEMAYFDAADRQRTEFRECESARTEAACVTRYNERTSGVTAPPACGKTTDAILPCMWKGGGCQPSPFAPVTVRCR